MEFDSFNAVVEHLGQYKLEAIPIYIGLQIIQIVISVIPGQVFQLAAGYLYTFLPALILSVTGAILGTMVSFYLARFLGSDFVHLFFGREKTLEYVEKLNSKKHIWPYSLYISSREYQRMLSAMPQEFQK